MDNSPVPPWKAYPGEGPFWSGWRQGVSEDWLLHVWLPFWRSLSGPAREQYMQRWPSPDEEWTAQLANWR